MAEILDEAATVAASPAASAASIEIVGERRRAHDAAFRAHVLTEAMAPGIRISDLARRHGICASLIYRWRREMSPRVGAASAVQLVPVQVNASGVIEIELAEGVRIRVDGEVSLVAVAAGGDRSTRVIAPPAGVRIWLVAGATDMRRGFDGLAAPFSCQVFAFRGRRSHLIKLLFWDGQGLFLYAKRLDRGHFVWPATGEGAVLLTPAQLSMLTEGIDWRAPMRTWRPELAGWRRFRLLRRDGVDESRRHGAEHRCPTIRPPCVPSSPSNRRRSSGRRSAASLRQPVPG